MLIFSITRRRASIASASSHLAAYLDIGANIDHDSAEIGAASDYHGTYCAALAARHYNTPMQTDGRLWTQVDVRDAGVPAQTPAARSVVPPSS